MIDQFSSTGDIDSKFEADKAEAKQDNKIAVKWDCKFIMVGWPPVVVS